MKTQTFKMKTQTFNLIHINWSREKPDAINNKRKNKRKNCLYIVYVDSPIYGNDVLLYIGQKNNFSKREEQHQKSDFERINNARYVIGTSDDFENKPNILDISESLLITMLKPSYNSSSIKDVNEYLKKTDKYLLLNNGDRESIPLEISNIWW